MPAAHLAIVCPACQMLTDSAKLKCGKCGASLATAPCPRCGHENAIDVPLCGKCYGDLRLKRCPHCQSPNLLVAVVCPHCRQSMLLAESGKEESVSRSRAPAKSGNLWDSGLILFAGVSVVAILLMALRHNPSRALALSAAVLGSFIVPITVTFLLWDAILKRRIPGIVFVQVFASGAVLGAAASLPLYVIVPLIGLGFGALLAVPVVIGAAEELGKVVSTAWLFRQREQSPEWEGFVYGFTAGLGFAALEGVSYGLLSYFTEGASRLAQTLVIRAILTTFAHASWTGCLTAIVWRERRIAVQFTMPVLNMYIGVAVLHALWDYMILPGVAKNRPEEGFAFMTISGLCTLALLIVRIQSAMLSARSAKD